MRSPTTVPTAQKPASPCAHDTHTAAHASSDAAASAVESRHAKALSGRSRTAAIAEVVRQDVAIELLRHDAADKQAQLLAAGLTAADVDAVVAVARAVEAFDLTKLSTELRGILKLPDVQAKLASDGTAFVSIETLPSWLASYLAKNRTRRARSV